MVPHAQHFGERVAERRRRLSLTVVDINRHGGPTAPTVIKAEAGALEDPRPSTLAKFDTALCWPRGSAAAIYWNGEEPRPEDADSRRIREPGSASLNVPLDRLIALLSALRALNDCIDGRSGSTVSVDGLRPVVEMLNEHTSAVTEHFVTNVLERHRSSENGEMLPLVEHAFARLAIPTTQTFSQDCVVHRSAAAEGVG